MKHDKRKGSKIKRGRRRGRHAKDRVGEKTYFVIKVLLRLVLEDVDNVLDEDFILSSASLSRRPTVSSDSSATSSPKPSLRT
jgi:hypothetical protein